MNKNQEHSVLKDIENKLKSYDSSSFDTIVQLLDMHHKNHSFSNNPFDKVVEELIGAVFKYKSAISSISGNVKRCDVDNALKRVDDAKKELNNIIEKSKDISNISK